MTTMKVKQLQNPGATVQTNKSSAGSVIVLDGSYPVWSGSDSATSGIIVPNGTTNQRPTSGTEATGLMRFNTTTGKPEMYTGSSWQNVVVGTLAVIGLSDAPNSYTNSAKKFVRVNAAANAVEFTTASFTDLADAPSSFSGNANKGVRVNSGATGLEFYTLVTAIKRYRYLVSFSSSTTTVIGSGGVDDAAGWTVTGWGTSALTFTHNMGKEPCFYNVFGKVQNQTKLNNALVSAITMSYWSDDLSKVTMSGITAGNCQTYSNGASYIDFYFIV